MLKLYLFFVATLATLGALSCPTFIWAPACLWLLLIFVLLVEHRP